MNVNAFPNLNHVVIFIILNLNHSHLILYSDTWWSTAAHDGGW